MRALPLPDSAAAVRGAALEVAEIVRALDADDEVVIAAVVQPLLDAKLLTPDAADKLFGVDATRLARALSQLGEFGLPSGWTPEQGLESGQAEALRKMLLAVIGDVRLVVVRLAAQLQKMRSAKSLNPTVQRKFATETREVYAPLANQLGVWQLKWELEDLAFRYLQPVDYRHVAAALKLRRSEREIYIDELKTTLRAALSEAGIEAKIDGRPKHIYSIWRKMQSKQLAFEELMDIRAARLLVAGYSGVNVAAIAGLSENTVRTYVRRLYAKIGVSNRADLVRKLVAPEPKSSAPSSQIAPPPDSALADGDDTLD